MVLLADSVDPRDATAAVALERIAYIVGTTIIVGIGSVAALIGFPLSALWTRVFTAFAIGAVVIATLTGAGRGRARDLPPGAAASRRRQRWARASQRDVSAAVLAAVERQILELVRSHPSRLVVLMTATIAAYACMALEAWVILRATPTPTSLTGALAVETFSRVASFGSAFIPANLGALEASSLAAVAAVGAAGGGAALALARRLRGLFWAGLGLAIYPRTGALSHDTGTNDPPSSNDHASHAASISPHADDVTSSAVGASGRPPDRRTRCPAQPSKPATDGSSSGLPTDERPTTLRATATWARALAVTVISSSVGVAGAHSRARSDRRLSP